MAIYLSPCWATKVYKHTAEDGTVFFSDTPQQGAEEIVIPPVQTYHDPQSGTLSSPTTPTTPLQEEVDKLIPTTYQIVFSTPENNQVFTPAMNKVEVKLYTQPALHQHDKVQLYIDGEPYQSKSHKTEFTITELSRGTHTLQAKIYGKEHKKPKGSTESITIIVQQAINRSSGAVPQVPQAPKLP